MSLWLAMIQSRHSNDERETPMTQTATTAFINALIVRVRESMTTGAQPPRAQTVRRFTRPMFDPVLIPAYRRRRLLPSRVAQPAPMRSMERET
jgi:hypothetical protein